MANEITAKVEFSFKGINYTPSTVLDLDDIMQKHGTLPSLHQLLARLHNIDSYSYEYEMMEAENIQFSDAEGWVTGFVTDNQFDQTGFEQQWHEQDQLNRLAPIIKRQLNIDDIQQHPELKKVILTAYQFGKKNSKAD
ncbi:MAG: hypothetical protein DRQ39_02410 [Gammaproteobacteria bacterium]|nr:MAG: hypothetical protein DRQ39_02410 [Gammaproteobacteria bacterium]RKZ97928.1 MAG: hypothetical protein DRQ46_03580 [Gammaproteobacteria bacterium]